MALWGTDQNKSEQKPTWQQDKDPDGSKGRPATNEERNTFASTADRTADPKRKHSGWVRKVVKTVTDPDGTVRERVIEELLVATSNSVSNTLPDRLGSANITSIAFRTTSFPANSVGCIDTSANLIIDVSFNEAVDVTGGTATIEASNSTSDFLLTVYPEQWNGISSTWGVGTQNNTNLLSFVTPLDNNNTGNGQIKITGAAITPAGDITDNIGGFSSILTTDGYHITALGNVASLSTANAVISGNVFERNS